MSETGKIQIGSFSVPLTRGTKRLVAYGAALLLVGAGAAKLGFDVWEKYRRISVVEIQRAESWRHMPEPPEVELALDEIPSHFGSCLFRFYASDGCRYIGCTLAGGIIDQRFILDPSRVFSPPTAARVRDAAHQALAGWAVADPPRPASTGQCVPSPEEHGRYDGYRWGENMGQGWQAAYWDWQDGCIYKIAVHRSGAMRRLGWVSCVH